MPTESVASGCSAHELGEVVGDSKAASSLEGTVQASVGGTGDELVEPDGGDACTKEASCGHSTGAGEHGELGGNLAAGKNTFHSPHTLGEPASPRCILAHAIVVSDDATQLEEVHVLFS